MILLITFVYLSPFSSFLNIDLEMVLRLYFYINHNVLACHISIILCEFVFSSFDK